MHIDQQSIILQLKDLRVRLQAVDAILEADLKVLTKAEAAGEPDVLTIRTEALRAKLLAIYNAYAPEFFADQFSALIEQDIQDLTTPTV